MRRFTPETEYLLDLARAWGEGVSGTVPPPSALNRERFLRLLSSQPAMQTLVPRLDPAAVPDADRTRLDQAVEVSRRRTTLLLLELERALPALAEIGCRPIVLKGASLALTVYPRPEDRWFIDLDLLVPLEQLDGAIDVLTRLGYHGGANHQNRLYYDKYHFHRILISTQGICIEVHWNLTMPRSIYSYDLGTLWQSAVEIPLGGACFLAPSAIDQVLHGVLQSIPAGFGDLRRVLDLHLLERTMSDEDRDVLWARAQLANLSTGLWLQYRLRELILNAPIPTMIEQGCRPSPGLVHIFDQLDLVSACLSQRMVGVEGFTRLIHWLCVPPPMRGREIRRFVVPSEELFLAAQLDLGRKLSVWDRVRLVSRHWLISARLLTRLARAAV
ncbi:MAG TPA: nucleotidyltransferase family protein [Candidatus Krumholzibacteria bacterium]|nr:nucleotidyltransferase family protein [Candidatus Krumholzibacteria bacterium]HPD73229.1 nucleotidyltransferase family protein [Candidatus Krumholzibacteria bacterium]HRY40191.1 nucleotidyltransferase family protein [Candidatus Krumholzibacteria bacterium]